MKRPVTLTTLCLTIAAVLWLSSTLTADVVSGRVLGTDDKPIPTGSFTAKDVKGNATVFKTDKTGNFSVYLDPGMFTVSNAADATVEGVIESYPQPRQQDVHLKKKAGK